MWLVPGAPATQCIGQWWSITGCGTTTTAGTLPKCFDCWEIATKEGHERDVWVTFKNITTSVLYIYSLVLYKSYICNYIHMNVIHTQINIMANRYRQITYWQEKCQFKCLYENYRHQALIRPTRRYCWGQPQKSASPLSSTLACLQWGIAMNDLREPPSN